MNPSSKLSWSLQIVAAAILLQTLFFKFTAAPEAVALFDTISSKLTGNLSLSAPVRLFTGVLELIAGVLLLMPSRVWVGAALSVNLMIGAVITHLGLVGIEVADDGGTLFILALIVLAASSALLWIHRAKFLETISPFRKQV